jgi:hypothetical protein
MGSFSVVHRTVYDNPHDARRFIDSIPDEEFRRKSHEVIDRHYGPRAPSGGVG